MYTLTTEQIISIEEVEPTEDQWVYDIEMEDPTTPYFFGNDILVHNSTYFTTMADNKESAVVIADAVGENVNDSFPEFMREVFLCSEGFDTLIAAGREIVASAGIFVTPKKYVLQIVDKEGDAKDELKIMGLDLKKTTLPKVFQDKLSGYIGRLLKGEDWDPISRDIVGFKDEIIATADVSALGLPKGIKGIEDYTKQYEIHGAGTRLPGHVAAAIYYNIMLKEHDDRESFRIVSDMKIKIYYMMNKVGKFKSIALPTDLEQIPKWFYDEVQVDRAAQVLRLVDRPLENILKAIGKKAPTKKTIFISDMFEMD